MEAKDPALHFQHSTLGYTYGMSNVLAGIGRGQLKVLQDRIDARRRIYERYADALGDLPGVSFMPEAAFGRSNRWLTAMLIDQAVAKVSPAEVMAALEQANIESRLVWKPMHLQPMFEKYPYYPHEENSSVSEQLFRDGLCLPSGSNMTAADQERVIAVIKQCFEKARG